MSPRAQAGAEVERILAMVPWIIDHPDAHKREIAERFGITEEQVDADLSLIMMIGVPPYSPLDLLEVHEDDDGHVEIFMGNWFTRPLQLSPAEGLALLAAGRALLAVPGADASGALGTALAKLGGSLALPDVGVAVEDPEHLAAVRAAVSDHARIEIDYWSANRDAFGSRRIDPEVVFFALGNWYSAAYCHAAQGERMFRVDRIRAVRPTGEHFEAGAAGIATEAIAAGDVFRAGPEDMRVTLLLAPGAAWVAEAYAADAVTERDDGTLEVVLAVSRLAWIERLLLRLGPQVRVLDPPEAREFGAEGARRVLARYAVGGDDGPSGSSGAGSGRGDTDRTN